MEFIEKERETEREEGGKQIVGLDATYRHTGVSIDPKHCTYICRYVGICKFLERPIQQYIELNTIDWTLAFYNTAYADKMHVCPPVSPLWGCPMLSI
jgi:hypothetical protein